MKQDRNIFLVVVDDSPEFPAAMRCAMRMAHKCGGHVELLRIIQPVGFQHWGGISKQIEDGQRKSAEDMLWKLVNDCHASIDFDVDMFIFNVQRGRAIDTVLKTLDEDPSISMLVLAGGTMRVNSGPLVSYFTGKGLFKLKVPIVVVPEEK